MSQTLQADILNGKSGSVRILDCISNTHTDTLVLKFCHNVREDMVLHLSYDARP
jgi:hypothetical protein